MLKNSHRSINRCLVLAPHTDDGEFGCGGSIAKLVEEGVDVYYVAFSSCEKSITSEFPSNILTIEVKAATQILGVPKENLILYDYEARTFSYHRQEILDNIIKLRDELEPDMVFMPSLNDIHQDHHTVAHEGVRAMKFSTILCYEMPWNNFSFHTSAFVHLEESHIYKKVEAIKEYKSQSNRPYASEEFIRSLARTRGTHISTKYAETFEVVRWIIK